MTTENQNTYRQYLQSRYDANMESHSRYVKLANDSTGSIKDGYNSLAANVLNTAREIQDCLNQFDELRKVPINELSERIKLLENHSKSLRRILDVVKEGNIIAVADHIGLECAMLTDHMQNLQKQCEPC